MSEHEMLDVELKCKVTETVHEDFIVAARQLGFADKSKFLRYLVERELYGVSAQLHIAKMPGAYPGQSHK